MNDKTGNDFSAIGLVGLVGLVGPLALEFLNYLISRPTSPTGPICPLTPYFIIAPFNYFPEKGRSPWIFFCRRIKPSSNASGREGILQYKYLQGRFYPRLE